MRYNEKLLTPDEAEKLIVTSLHNGVPFKVSEHQSGKEIQLEFVDHHEYFCVWSFERLVKEEERVMREIADTERYLAHVRDVMEKLTEKE